MIEFKPGSKEAIQNGCTCPVMDNHHGQGIPMRHPETGEPSYAFWMDNTCPLHGTDKSEFKE